jgi:hypothetical protein
MSLGQRLRGLHDGRARPRRSAGMVGLVALSVEDGHDAVAREVLDDAAGLVDGRDDDGPERVEHLEHLGRLACLAERREAGQVGEDHAHLALLAAERLRVPLAAPDALGDDRRQIRLEGRIESSKFAPGPRQQGNLLRGRSLAAQLVENRVDRGAVLVDRRDGRDRAGVPAVDPRQRRLEVEAAEGPGQ